MRKLWPLQYGTPIGRLDGVLRLRRIGQYYNYWRMAVKVGVTGTRMGMTDAQKDTVVDLMVGFRGPSPKAEFHHGDCVGVDQETHHIAVVLGYNVHIHPPLNPNNRAGMEGGTVWPEKEYLARNRDIVDNSDVLIAVPFEFDEVLRSGTWSTVRYAVLKLKPVYVVQPDGNIVKRGKYSAQGSN